MGTNNDKIKRNVFFSFHYSKDNWRAAQIKNMGVVDESSEWNSNGWEEVKAKTSDKIEEWIDARIEKCSCLVVLIGEETSERKWVKYEIEKAYNLCKALLGVYVNKLEDSDGKTSLKGKNPFGNFTLKGKPLSDYVDVLNPSGNSGKEAYADIKEKLPNLIEKAIESRKHF